MHESVKILARKFDISILAEGHLRVVKYLHIEAHCNVMSLVKFVSNLEYSTHIGNNHWGG